MQLTSMVEQMRHEKKEQDQTLPRYYNICVSEDKSQNEESLHRWKPRYPNKNVSVSRTQERKSTQQDKKNEGFMLPPDVLHGILVDLDRRLINSFEKENLNSSLFLDND